MHTPNEMRASIGYVSIKRCMWTWMPSKVIQGLEHFVKMVDWRVQNDIWTWFAPCVNILMTYGWKYQLINRNSIRHLDRLVIDSEL
jgi:hypothetical protein